MKKKYLVIGIVIILIVSILYIAIKIYDEKEASLSGGDFKMMFLDNTRISAENITAGWTSTKTFTIKNESDSSFPYNIVLKNLVNTFVTTGGLQYKITSDNDGYNMSDYADIPKSATATDTVLAYNISIPVGVTQTYTITFRYLDVEDNSSDLGKTLSGTLAITEGAYPKLYDKLLLDNPTRLTRSDFSTVFEDENVNTLYTVDGKWTEDGSTVYYFAGNAQNNWVKFGQDQDGADLYWRIIRTNEDGSIRLLYIGPDMTTESAFPVLDGTVLSGGSDTTGCYNCTNYNNTMYVGYMYGTTGDLVSNRTNENSSPIKTVIDNWYSKTLNTKTDGTYTYDSYVSKTAIYCNDRSTNSYATAHMYYGAYYRHWINKQPSYKCGNDATGTLYSTADVADKFSVSTASGGNGDLTYGVALMTADEVAFAGGVFSEMSTPWYYYNASGVSAVGTDYWWIMSPCFVFDGHAYVFGVSGSSYDGTLGFFSFNKVYSADSYSLGARPVISLKSCVFASGGDGSSANPYILEIDDTCAAAEN